MFQVRVGAGKYRGHSMGPSENRGNVLNPQPRPRVAAVGIDSDTLDQLEPLCGTLYRDTVPNLAEVDLIVSRWDLKEPVPAHVLLWGSGGLHEIRRPSESTWEKMSTQTAFLRDSRSHPDPIQFAQMVHGFRRKGSDVRDDIMEILGPELAVIGRDRQIGREIRAHPEPRPFEPGIAQLFDEVSKDASDVSGIASLRVGEVPLVWTTDASLVALYSPVGDETDRRTLGDIENWDWVGLSLPHQADLRLWLRCFLEFLHSVDRDAVPRRPPLLGSPSDWNTPDQIVLAKEVIALESEIRTLLDQRSELLGRVEALGSDADTGVRRVLWSKDDELVEAVATLLRELGFDVTEVDQELEPGEAKWEDLRIRAPESNTQILGEVKGYPNDARVKDLSQLRTQRERHLKLKSEEPTSWWIFNDHRNTPDPSDRPPSLRGHVDRVETQGVVAIPTRDLYRLWRAVGVGEISADEARALLVGAPPGLFNFPAMVD